MSETTVHVTKPELRAAQRWNIVWLIPILCVLIGAWMLYDHVSSKGKEVRLRFQTAEGIIAGKTELRCRSVNIGKVTKIELSEDLQSTFVYCVLDKENEKLLRKGSRFWVVRPRVTAGDVSGLGTLLTGIYIEMEPGSGPTGPTRWVGRETPPPTSRSVPGLRLTLSAKESGVLSIGAPVTYLGYEVGKVEVQKFDIEQQRVLYQIFIPEKYRSLVRSNTKFWNAGGIDIVGDVKGFKLKTGSLQSIVSGGISFALNPGVSPAEAAINDTVFELYKDEQTAKNSEFKPSIKLLLLFDQSVRGLAIDAPVEFRGVQIGIVRSISFEQVSDSNNRKVPVVIELDPIMMRAIGSMSDEDNYQLLLTNAVKNGLRASLKTGNLLTGSMFIDFDYYPKEKSLDLGYLDDLPIIPTISSGFAQLETKIFAILDKMESLPLEEAVKSFTATASEAEQAIQELEKVSSTIREYLAKDEIKKMPSEISENLIHLKTLLKSVGPDGNLQGDLLRTLDELRSALRSIESVSDLVEEQPNSLFFGKEESGNPKPKAAR